MRVRGSPTTLFLYFALEGVPVERSKRKAEPDTSRYKNRALLFGLIAIALLFSVYAIAPVYVGASDQDIIQVGSMTAILTLDTLALDDQGNYIESVNPNSPLYIGEVAVEQIRAFITFDAVGDFIDWSTLDVSIKLEVNGVDIETSHYEGESGSSSFYAAYEKDIINLDDFLSPSEGGELYIRALAVTTFDDHAGNHLESQDMALNSWTFTDTEGGDPDVMIEPQFTTVPFDVAIEQGDSLDLTWIAADDNPNYHHIKTYTIYDGTTVQALGYWSSGDSLTWNAGEYISSAPGDYELLVTCRITDEDDNIAYDTCNIQVHVVAAPDAPRFLKSTGPTSWDTTFFEQLIVFKPYSEIPMSYRIYHNGGEIDSGSWAGADIPVFIDTLYEGQNDIKCTVFDTEGRDASYTHTVTVGADDGLPTRETDGETNPLVNSPFSTGTGITMVMALIVVTIVAGYYTIKWMVER